MSEAREEAGKNAIPSLGYEIHPVFFKKRDRILRRKAVNRRIQKFGIADDICDKLPFRTAVRYIASALPGNVDFLPGLLVFFDQENPMIRIFRRFQRAHQPGRSSSDNANPHSACPPSSF